nr:type II secretion system F family protein [Lientehia hominis]
MLLDYPELVSKFTVLVQAGMTTRNVWERMVREYEGKKDKGQKSRYAYEEMRITWNQMKNGVYESAAYEEFGRRCGLHSYLKFGALLEQNLRQGTTGLAVRLKKEAEEAFENRKNVARRLGEEAETKMMLPMFMMLFVVLTVIMVPAFLSF